MASPCLPADIISDDNGQSIPIACETKEDAYALRQKILDWWYNYQTEMNDIYRKPSDPVAAHEYKYNQIFSKIDSALQDMKFLMSAPIHTQNTNSTETYMYGDMWALLDGFQESLGDTTVYVPDAAEQAHLNEENQ